MVLKVYLFRYITLDFLIFPKFSLDLDSIYPQALSIIPELLGAATRAEIKPFFTMKNCQNQSKSSPSPVFGLGFHSFIRVFNEISLD